MNSSIPDETRERAFIEDFDLYGKRVLIRSDFNVPLDANQNIRNASRIESSLKTIRYARNQGAKVILISHMGRPNGRRVEKLSLKPVAELLSRMLNQSVDLVPESVGSMVEKRVARLQNGEVVLLENLRFHPGETDNKECFARSLACLCDIYVNDAFGAAHRAHASTAGIARFSDHVAMGYLLQLEIRYLDKIRNYPSCPFVVILGGAKVSDKVKVIQNLLRSVQVLIIGGGMACTFYRALGYEIGDSLLEEEALPVVREILQETEKQKVSLLLAEDCVIAERVEESATMETIQASQGVPAGWKILDIGPRAVHSFSQTLQHAKTVFWNGPMGVFESGPFARGTFGIARALGDATKNGAMTVVGGGDSVAAIEEMGLTKHISHLSTGGGASLEFLEGLPLPGIEAIPKRVD